MISSTRSKRASPPSTAPSMRCPPSASSGRGNHADALMRRPRDGARPAGGPACPHQGPHRGGGRAHHLRLADLRGSRARHAPTSWSSGWSARAGSSTPSRTRPSSAPVPTPSTRSSAPPSTPGTRRARPAAGSSGGAAVALATGMAWLANGSDLGGSLRTPAALLRQSSASGPRPVASPHGPAASPSTGRSPSRARWRATVEDVALMLDALAGYDPRDPVSLRSPRRRSLPLSRSGCEAARASPSAPTSADHAGRHRGR